MKPTDKIAVIHGVLTVVDISLTKIISILSVMGLEVSPIPSIRCAPKEMSTTCETEKVELEDYIEQCRKMLKEENVIFKTILIGNLGYDCAVDSTARFVNSFPSATVVIQPYFANRGKCYEGFDLNYVERIKQLISIADIITPNFTEACFLSGEEFKGEVSEWKILKICYNLEKIGAKNIIITDIPSEDKKTVKIAIFSNSKLEMISVEKLRGNYPDSGAIFTAVLTGAIENKKSLKESVVIAEEFLKSCILESNKHRYSNKEGLIYENSLKKIIK